MLRLHCLLTITASLKVKVAVICEAFTWSSLLFNDDSDLATIAFGLKSVTLINILMFAFYELSSLKLESNVICY